MYLPTCLSIVVIRYEISLLDLRLICNVQVLGRTYNIPYQLVLYTI